MGPASGLGSDSAIVCERGLEQVESRQPMLFSKRCFLSSCCVPGSALGTEDTAVGSEQSRQNPCSHGADTVVGKDRQETKGRGEAAVR